MSTREEKRALTQARRAQILCDLNDVVRAELQKATSTQAALAAGDRWLDEQIRKRPQEKSLYLDAARTFGKLMARDAYVAENQQQEEEK